MSDSATETPDDQQADATITGAKIQADATVKGARIQGWVVGVATALAALLAVGAGWFISRLDTEGNATVSQNETSEAPTVPSPEQSMTPETVTAPHEATSQTVVEEDATAVESETSEPVTLETCRSGPDDGYARMDVVDVWIKPCIEPAGDRLIMRVYVKAAEHSGSTSLFARLNRTEGDTLEAVVDRSCTVEVVPHGPVEACEWAIQPESGTYSVAATAGGSAWGSCTGVQSPSVTW